MQTQSTPILLLQLNLTYMKQILHLVSVKNIPLSPLDSKLTFSGGLLRSLTAIFSHVHNHLNYYIYIM